MGKGFLFQARDDWRAVCRGIGKTPSEQFLDTVGGTAEYKHIGLDSHQAGNTRVCHAQPFAVFEGGGNRYVFTPLDLEALGNHVKTHKDPAVRTHMTAQMAKAAIDLKANEPLIAERAPMANRPRNIAHG